MKLIRGICRTNLDEHKKDTWPTKFLEIPRIGDGICNARGFTLFVVKIIHRECFNNVICDLNIGDPFIEIELHHLSSIPK